MVTYALNGLGRIGKLALLPFLENGDEIGFLNAGVRNSEMHEHFLEFDTVNRLWLRNLNG